jgi:hypothetical protein
MVEQVNIAFDYTVAGAAVSLSVDVGDGGVGGTSLTLDGAAIGTPGDVQSQAIGNGPDISGKKLIAKTLVADVNGDTTSTSVTYTLTGGAAHPPFTFSHQLSDAKDAALYTTTITFK